MGRPITGSRRRSLQSEKPGNASQGGSGETGRRDRDVREAGAARAASGSGSRGRAAKRREGRTSSRPRWARGVPAAFGETACRASRLSVACVWAALFLPRVKTCAKDHLGAARSHPASCRSLGGSPAHDELWAQGTVHEPRQTPRLRSCETERVGISLCQPDTLGVAVKAAGRQRPLRAEREPARLPHLRALHGARLQPVLTAVWGSIRTCRPSR